MRGQPNSRRVGGPYGQARAQRELYQGLLKKLEYEKARGHLLEREDVRATWTKALINFRGTVDRIPALCCSKCRPTVDDAIGAALNALIAGSGIKDES